MTHSIFPLFYQQVKEKYYQTQQNKDDYIQNDHLRRLTIGNHVIWLLALTRH